MSNPGVIVLADAIGDGGRSFRIEDNIGESIHLHDGPLRIDFTVESFLEFAEAIRQAVETLVGVPGFALDSFDPVFLAALGDGICDLESIEVDEVRLSDLRVFTDCWYGVQLRPLSESRAVRALRGDVQRLAAHRQDNLFGTDNFERLQRVVQEVREVGYPTKDRHIVLFNDQDVIRDGQHRAAALYHLSGDRTVPVHRMRFNGGRFDIAEPGLARQLPSRVRQDLRRMLRQGYHRVRRRLELARANR